MTTSQLGRTKLVVWPDLNEAAGASQVNGIQASVLELSNNAPARIKAFAAPGDSATIEIDHNFGLNLSQLTVLIYSGVHPSFTRIQDPFGLTPTWAVNEKAGSEKLVIEVITPSSGTPATFSVVVINDVMKDYKVAFDSRAVSSDITLVDKILYRVDTSAARTLTLPAASDKLYIPIKDVTGSAATNNITLVTPGAENIDGAASYLVESDYASLAIISDGTNYFVV